MFIGYGGYYDVYPDYYNNQNRHDVRRVNEDAHVGHGRTAGGSSDGSSSYAGSSSSSAQARADDRRLDASAPVHVAAPSPVDNSHRTAAGTVILCLIDGLANVI